MGKSGKVAESARIMIGPNNFKAWGDSGQIGDTALWMGVSGNWDLQKHFVSPQSIKVGGGVICARSWNEMFNVSRFYSLFFNPL